MKKTSYFSRIITTFLAVTYLSTNCLFAYSPESNFWAERLKSTTSLRNYVPSIKANTFPSSNWINKYQTHGVSISQPLRELLNAIPLSHATINDVFVPASLGLAGKRQSYAGASPLPVVIIQDVHLNVEAQSNIAAVLQNLIDQKQVGCVGVEGAFTPFNFKPFRSFADKQATSKVMDAYLNKKLIAAASYVGVVSPTEPPAFIGIDDREHYDANVDAYLSTRSTKEKVSNELSKLRLELMQKKKASFLPNLLAFDELFSAYHSNKITLGEYLTKLSKRGELHRPSLDLFLAASDLERKLNFNRVEVERKQVFEKLTQRLSKEDLSNLVDQSLAYQQGQLGFGDYYRNIKDICKEKEVSLKAYPSFESYLQYVLLSDGIKAESIFEDLNRLEQSLIQDLAKNPREKELIAESEYLVLTQKLIEFELTPKEWEKYKTLAHGPWTIDNRLSFSSFEKFYEEADIRSEKMTENLLTAVPGTAALIVGGFHTPFITQLLKEKHIPHIVLSPKISKVDTESGSAYLALFAREKTPLEKMFQGEKLFLALENQQLTYNNTGLKILGSLYSYVAHKSKFTWEVKQRSIEFNVKASVTGDPTSSEISIPIKERFSSTLALLWETPYRWIHRQNEQTNEQIQEMRRNIAANWAPWESFILAFILGLTVLLAPQLNWTTEFHLFFSTCIGSLWAISHISGTYSKKDGGEISRVTGWASVGQVIRLTASSILWTNAFQIGAQLFFDYFTPEHSLYHYLTGEHPFPSPFILALQILLLIYIALIPAVIHRNKNMKKLGIEAQKNSFSGYAFLWRKVTADPQQEKFLNPWMTSLELIFLLFLTALIMKQPFLKNLQESIFGWRGIFDLPLFVFLIRGLLYLVLGTYFKSDDRTQPLRVAYGIAASKSVFIQGIAGIFVAWHWVSDNKGQYYNLLRWVFSSLLPMGYYGRLVNFLPYFFSLNILLGSFYFIFINLIKKAFPKNNPNKNLQISPLILQIILTQISLVLYLTFSSTNYLRNEEIQIAIVLFLILLSIHSYLLKTSNFSFRKIQISVFDSLFITGIAGLIFSFYRFISWAIYDNTPPGIRNSYPYTTDNFFWIVNYGSTYILPLAFLMSLLNFIRIKANPKDGYEVPQNRSNSQSFYGVSKLWEIIIRPRINSDEGGNTSETESRLSKKVSGIVHWESFIFVLITGTWILFLNLIGIAPSQGATGQTLLYGIPLLTGAIWLLGQLLFGYEKNEQNVLTVRKSTAQISPLVWGLWVKFFILGAYIFATNWIFMSFPILNPSDYPIVRPGSTTIDFSIFIVGIGWMMTFISFGLYLAFDQKEKNRIWLSETIKPAAPISLNWQREEYKSGFELFLFTILFGVISAAGQSFVSCTIPLNYLIFSAVILGLMRGFSFLFRVAIHPDGEKVRPGIDRGKIVFYQGFNSLIAFIFAVNVSTLYLVQPSYNLFVFWPLILSIGVSIWAILNQRKMHQANPIGLVVLFLLVGTLFAVLINGDISLPPDLETNLNFSNLRNLIILSINGVAKISVIFLIFSFMRIVLKVTDGKQNKPQKANPQTLRATEKPGGTLFTFFKTLHTFGWYSKLSETEAWARYQLRDAHWMENMAFLLLIGLPGTVALMLLMGVDFNSAVSIAKALPLSFGLANLINWLFFAGAHGLDVMWHGGKQKNGRAPPVSLENVRAAGFIAAINIAIGFLPLVINFSLAQSLHPALLLPLLMVSILMIVPLQVKMHHMVNLFSIKGFISFIHKQKTNTGVTTYKPNFEKLENRSLYSASPVSDPLPIQPTSEAVEVGAQVPWKNFEIKTVETVSYLHRKINDCEVVNLKLTDGTAGFAIEILSIKNDPPPYSVSLKGLPVRERNQYIHRPDVFVEVSAEEIEEFSTLTPMGGGNGNNTGKSMDPMGLLNNPSNGDYGPANQPKWVGGGGQNQGGGNTSANKIGREKGPATRGLDEEKDEGIKAQSNEQGSTLSMEKYKGFVPDGTIKGLPLNALDKKNAQIDFFDKNGAPIGEPLDIENVSQDLKLQKIPEGTSKMTLRILGDNGEPVPLLNNDVTFTPQVGPEYIPKIKDDSYEGEPVLQVEMLGPISQLFPKTRNVILSLLIWIGSTFGFDMNSTQQNPFEHFPPTVQQTIQEPVINQNPTISNPTWGVPEHITVPFQELSAKEMSRSVNHQDQILKAQKDLRSARIRKEVSIKMLGQEPQRFLNEIFLQYWGDFHVEKNNLKDEFPYDTIEFGSGRYGRLKAKMALEQWGQINVTLPGSGRVTASLAFGSKEDIRTPYAAVISPDESGYTIFHTANSFSDQYVFVTKIRLGKEGEIKGLPYSLNPGQLVRPQDIPDSLWELGIRGYERGKDGDYYVYRMGVSPVWESGGQSFAFDRKANQFLDVIGSPYSSSDEMEINQYRNSVFLQLLGNIYGMAIVPDPSTDKTIIPSIILKRSHGSRDENHPALTAIRAEIFPLESKLRGSSLSESEKANVNNRLSNLTHQYEKIRDRLFVLYDFIQLDHQANKQNKNSLAAQFDQIKPWVDLNGNHYLFVGKEGFNEAQQVQSQLRGAIDRLEQKLKTSPGSEDEKKVRQLKNALFEVTAMDRLNQHLGISDVDMTPDAFRAEEEDFDRYLKYLYIRGNSALQPISKRKESIDLYKNSSQTLTWPGAGGTHVLKYPESTAEGTLGKLIGESGKGAPIEPAGNLKTQLLTIANSTPLNLRINQLTVDQKTGSKLGDAAELISQDKANSPNELVSLGTVVRSILTNEVSEGNAQFAGSMNGMIREIQQSEIIIQLMDDKNPQTSFALAKNMIDQALKINQPVRFEFYSANETILKNLATLKGNEKIKVAIRNSADITSYKKAKESGIFSQDDVSFGQFRFVAPQSMKKELRNFIGEETWKPKQYRLFMTLTDTANPLTVEIELDQLKNLDKLDKWVRTILSQA